MKHIFLSPYWIGKRDMTERGKQWPFSASKDEFFIVVGRLRPSPPDFPS
jgi:hypothetical protein